MPWVTRGLRDGVVTTRYPHKPDGYGGSFRGSVQLVSLPDPPEEPRGGTPDPPGRASLEEPTSICPTGAIRAGESGVELDRGKCILCGRCVTARPDLFRFDPDFEVASLHRHLLVEPSSTEDLEELTQLRQRLAERVKALRRSVHIRHVDAGSDGSEEWEIAALNNPVYDIQRLGLFFTASPRHADLLLVTGAGTAGMVEPLRRTWQAMPTPKVVVAAGTDAISGGIVHPTYATRGGISHIVPVDVWIPGSPPSPFSLLHGILVAVGMLPVRRDR